MTRYDREFLERFCQENDIKYENIDESVNITRDKRVKGHCKGENCTDMFEKTVKYLTICGPFCKKCTQLFSKEKVKKTNLERYGVEYSLQSKEVRDKGKETNLERYGVENPLQSKEVRDKVKSTNLERYGVEYASQSKEVRDKVKATNLERYGVENPLQSEDIKSKLKQTCLEKYGVENPLQSKEVKEKGKKTNLERYGVEYSNQSEQVKDKIKETNLERYGVVCTLHNEQVRDKVIETNLERYGVEHHMQNAEIAEKASKKCYKLKDYTFSSGKVIKCQGYEPYALDILISEYKIEEDDIITSRKDVPEIWYKDSDDKDHRYYVDIFIKSLNKFVEVKSTWTYIKNKEKVEVTKNKVKDRGFLYECWVFDRKGKIVETIN